MNVRIGNSLAARERRRELAAWVEAHIFPREPRVRHWLRARKVTREDVDEIIQDAYCRIAMLDDVSHIDRPDAYFFSICRNLLVRRLRRQEIIPFEAIAEVDAYLDEQPNPEERAGGKSDYARLLQLIAQLPDRCGQVFRLRKIEGWSQKRVAEHLGTTEKAIEKQMWLGLRAVRSAWKNGDNALDEKLTSPDDDRKSL